MKLLGELYNYRLVGSSGESLAHELLHGGCAMGGAGGASGGADEDDEGDDKGGGADDVAVAYEAEVRPRAMTSTRSLLTRRSSWRS